MVFEAMQYAVIGGAVLSIAITPLLFSYVEGRTRGRGVKYRHVKSGGIYIYRSVARCERTGNPVVIYSGEDGIVWVRDYYEFFDGRFEKV